MRRLAIALAVLVTACVAPSGDDVDATPIEEESAEVASEITPGTLRIMSFNIKNGEIAGHDLGKLVDPIRPSNPDVLALQEVDEGTQRSGGLAETTGIAAQLGMAHSYFGKNFSFDGGSYGLAIVSKYPLSNTRTIRLDDRTTRANGYEPRIAVAADVSIDAKKITVVSIHASLHEEERAENARRIVSALGSSASHAIIMGDLNETPSKDMGDAFTDAGFKDAYNERHPLSLGFTMPASPNPLKRIDFMYKGSSFGRTKHAWVPDVKTSDHRPVAAVVYLP
jgi:endonuclease/exonuclease/phosphatase family metal-dependent hydrolase